MDTALRTREQFEAEWRQDWQAWADQWNAQPVDHSLERVRATATYAWWEWWK